MKGTVLDYSMQTSVGFITGEDGKRYGFPAAEWKEAAPPARGVVVDFEIQEGKAVAIYLVAGSSTAPKKGGHIPRTQEYEGWYKSTDDKVLSGVCGGLAHRWNMNTNVLRVTIVVLGVLFWLPVLIYIGLELGLSKKLPTKGIQMT